MADKRYGIIPALDITDLTDIQSMIEEIDDLDIIYGYKIGFSLGLGFGLPRVVDSIRSISTKPVIYDHQKAATDIPATGVLFADTMKRAGIDEVILFPQAGPVTLTAWIEALVAAQMRVIVGALMTHPRYTVSEGGYIADEAITSIFNTAFESGVRDFVVPLTKPDIVRTIITRTDLDSGCRFYSPGYGKQGGDAHAFDFIQTHHLIIGRSLIGASDRRAFIEETTQHLEGVL